jgi:hypothetical protein
MYTLNADSYCFIPTNIISSRIEVLNQHLSEIPEHILDIVYSTEDKEFELFMADLIEELENEKNIDEFYDSLISEESAESAELDYDAVYEEWCASIEEDIFDQYLEVNEINEVKEVKEVNEVKEVKKSVLCKFGKKCKFLAMGTCTFSHPAKIDPKSVPCKFGKKCRHFAAGTCRNLH